MISPQATSLAGTAPPPSDAVPLAGAWVAAIMERRFADLAGALDPNVSFRALVPRGLREAETSDGAIAWVTKWFGDADRIELEDFSSGSIADRWWFRYRFLVHEPAGWTEIEQQVYATLTGTRIGKLDLLCSGFRPVEREGNASATLDAIGADCATLIPTLAQSVRELPAGGVLEVVTDDPTAGPSLDAWARLTGHEVVSAGLAPGATGGGTRAGHWLIRRKES
jgi:TusA-related sulfurtransferase